MGKKGLLIIMTMGISVFYGCASAEKPKTSTEAVSAIQETQEKPKDSVDKQIDARVSKLEKERRSKFRLNNLLAK